MKGGILLALDYQSTRYTKDIDFSTPVLLKDFDLESFKRNFDTSLAGAVDRLDYGLACAIQKCEQQPPSDDATFPTIRMTIGYAHKSASSAHRRLLKKNSSHVVQVDYSLNEPAGVLELLEIDAGLTIQTYSFHDLVGEKFRALLQQEVRNRYRRQDIYDLFFLLSTSPDCGDSHTKQEILKCLTIRAAARDIDVRKASMENPEIRRRSKRDYLSLRDEINEVLPPFDDVYDYVRAYYEGLPWAN